MDESHMAATSTIQQIIIGPLCPIHLQRNIMHHCQIRKNSKGEGLYLAQNVFSLKYADDLDDIIDDIGSYE